MGLIKSAKNVKKSEINGYGNAFTGLGGRVDQHKEGIPPIVRSRLRVFDLGYGLRGYLILIEGFGDFW